MMPHSSTNSHAGKLVVVTGANGGIGSAICKKFLELGAEVAAIDIMMPAGGTICFACDLTDDAATDEVATQILQQSGSPHAVIHAAAISDNATTLEATTASFLNIYNANVVSAVRLAKAFGPAMQRNGQGSFVFLSSINGQMGCPHLSAYAASKGALDSLTKTMALELAESGIRVNAIAPASIETPLLTDKFNGEANPKAALMRNAARHPIKRLGRPEEVAALAVFLCSEDAAWITGGVHLIDGGAHLARK